MAKNSGTHFGMKVFVYSKKTSNVVAEIKDVTNAISFPNDRLMLVQRSGDMTEWDTRVYKITLYQN